MPEKRFVRGCGPSCIRCWKNNLKHGSPEAKAWLKKNEINMKFIVNIPHQNDIISIKEEQENDKYIKIPIINNTGCKYNRGETGKFSIKKL